MGAGWWRWAAVVLLSSTAAGLPARAQPPVQLAELPQLPGLAESSQPAGLIVGVPAAYPMPGDQVVVEPAVRVGQAGAGMSDEMSLRWLQATRPTSEVGEAQPLFFAQEALPSPEIVPGPPPALPLGQVPSVLEVAPVFDELVATAPIRAMRPMPAEPGLGVERLAFSLFDIDPAQPFNNLRVRTALGQRMHLPDRAEYFWARTVDRRGPPRGEAVLNYQDLRLRLESGGKRFSAAFEVPFRAVDPRVNSNHAGLGDLQLIAKTVLLSGQDWLVTQYFGTHMPTGAPGMGLGTGHVSLEPGLLFRNKWRDDAWLHGELKFWFPLGADPQHGGQVVKFATGANRVWYDSDSSAWIPSLELTTYSVLNGLARDASGNLLDIDGDLMFYITPGLHYAVDGRGDMGLFEWGAAISFVTTRDRFTDATFICDVRWSW